MHPRGLPKNHFWRQIKKSSARLDSQPSNLISRIKNPLKSIRASYYQ